MIEHAIVIPAFIFGAFILGYYIGNQSGENIMTDIEEVRKELEALKARVNAKS